MKSFVGTLMLGVLCAASAQAAERPLFRTVSAPLLGPSLLFDQLEPMTVPPAPQAETMQPVPMQGAPVDAVPLFECVRYKDLRNIAPCAVPMIVQVKDPCACYDPCNCCAPQCVAVKICVPPCGCPKITCNKSGSRVKYDYGKYEVEIKSRRGRIIVDYDD